MQENEAPAQEIIVRWMGEGEGNDPAGDRVRAPQRENDMSRSLVPVVRQERCLGVRIR